MVGRKTGMESGVLDAVAVDLADVEVGLRFCNVGGWDPVCSAPDTGGGCCVLFGVGGC